MAHDMPTIGTYRGVPLHDFQPRARIEKVVKPAIDEVFGIADPEKLFTYAANNQNPPEARLFAAARCEACHQLAAESRVARPAIDLQLLRAHVAGLGSRQWVDPKHYTSVLDPYGFRAPLRETPLDKEEVRNR
jgi:hypothetical protein